MRQPAAAPAGAPLHRQQRGRQRGARTHHRGAPAAQRARRPRAGPGGGPSAEHALDGCGCRPPGPRQRRHAAPAWAPLLLAATCLLAHARAQQQQQQPQPNAAAADSAGYRPWQYNKACRYSASNIPANLFKNGIDGGVDYLFPLETSQAVNRYAQPWEACVPNFRDAFSMPQVAAGWKLPCRYEQNPDGTFNYEEDHACEVLIKSNCYCYAVDRFVGSYCEPGLGGTGEAFQLPVYDCTKATAGVVADGGRPVDRDAVYNEPRPPGGHYIALAIKPADTPDDTGDFHFWRLDSNGAWSYKAGDTLVRNTLRNGTAIRDIENDAKARGIYTKFCGYFLVTPATHKLVGNQFWYSNLPSRYKQWAAHGVKGTVTPLQKLPDAWLAAYKEYFGESGWEDGAARPRGRGRERAFVPRAGAGAARAFAGPFGEYVPPRGAARPPHWSSLRP